MDQPTFDLHSALAAMADYPAVLRRLGVIRIIEVELAGTAIDRSKAGPLTVTVTPAWTPELQPSENVHIAPVSVPVHLAPDRFALLVNGLLDAAKAGIGVAEIDVDSAASRLLDLGRQLITTPITGADGTTTLDPKLLPGTAGTSLPALRNAGLGLHQADRATKLSALLPFAAAMYSTTTATTLPDAQLAVKGWVVDVWDDRSGRWHTLCARRGTYKLPGGRSFTADDEGAVSSAATTASPTATAPVGPNALMYLNESMARWTGWSLVAPPVGKPVTTEDTVVADPNANPPVTVPSSRAPKPPAGPALPGFEVSFVPTPGTLPVLRFGRGYRFQLRAMDVIGRADPLNPTSTDFSRAVPPTGSAPVRHLRFDPVVAPVVVAAAPMTEGESVTMIVVRPDPAGGLLGVVSNLLAPLLATPPIRHLAPPKVSEGLCEEHGMVDTAAGRPDPAKYQILADRDRADLSTVGTQDPRQPRQRYVSGNLTVTWLPDPICRGAVLSGLPGGPVKARFDPPLLGSWPNIQPARLQLVDGTAAPSWNPLLRLLTVAVPRGETRTVRLSSFVDAADVGLLGHVGWQAADPASSAADRAATSTDVQAGQAWQITPSRTLTLINAVRRPNTPPTLVNIGDDASVPRTPGSTVHGLVGNAKVHRPSSGRLALVATSQDPVDDPAEPAPRTAVRIVTPSLRDNAGTAGRQAPSLPVQYEPNGLTGDQITFAATHVLGDTRRHQISYTVEATTRYLEQFVQRGVVTLTGDAALQLSTAGIVPGTAAVHSKDGTIVYREALPGGAGDFEVDAAAGTIRRTGTSTIPSGGQVEAAVVAPPVTAVSAPMLLDLPSTARPAPPQVAWVVPTFGWSDQQSQLGLKRVRTRGGGGLRVFLERGWYSSGVGEQLAVVLASAPGDASDPRLAELVTQVGGDPVFVTEPVSAAFPTLGQFPLATATVPGLTLPEFADRGTSAPRVVIAAHDVQWDADRQRWACDIVLPSGRVYEPFLHLALARYQPHSLGGVELSAVAPLEWAQLGPDRAATVVLDSFDLTKVTVTVAGWSGTASVARTPNAVSVIVQTSAVGNPGDLDWTTPGPVDGQRLTATTQPDGTTAWTGVLRLPRSRLLTPFRLVVVEQEQHSGGGRLVYSDVIRL